MTSNTPENAGEHRLQFLDPFCSGPDNSRASLTPASSAHGTWMWGSTPSHEALFLFRSERRRGLLHLHRRSYRRRTSCACAA